MRREDAKPANYENLRDLVLHAGEFFPQTQFFLCSDSSLPFITGQGLQDACGQFGSRIRHRGQAGSHIAILGPNSAAWLTCFFSVVSSGCAAVPLYFGSTVEELISCVQRSDTTILLYDRSCDKEAGAIQAALPGLEIIEMHALLYTLDQVPDHSFPALPPESTAALFFTSGTTAQSRCVILTHRNMGSMATAAMNCLPLSAEDVGLSLMPPSHTFEFMTNIIGALHCGGRLHINQSLRTVKSNLKALEPTIVVCVPLVLQMLQKEIRATARRTGRMDALERALKLNRSLRKLGIDFSRILFQDVYAVLGHNLRYFFCGGAALNPELIEFFDGLGITVFQGYGITECSPIVAANLPGANRPGSIGRVFPSCEVTLIDGEICVRGDSVSPGYYNDPEATAWYFRDGWFHTGDLGEFDDDGYLYFTGRCKNLIVLPNGENVSPEALEEKLGAIEGVMESVVYQKDGSITAEIYADPAVFPDRNALWQAINKVNRSVSSFQQIGALVMRDKPFEKTVTQKIKRFESGKEL